MRIIVVYFQMVQGVTGIGMNGLVLKASYIALAKYNYSLRRRRRKIKNSEDGELYPRTDFSGVCSFPNVGQGATS